MTIKSCKLIYVVSWDCLDKKSIDCVFYVASSKSKAINYIKREKCMNKFKGFWNIEIMTLDKILDDELADNQLCPTTLYYYNKAGKEINAHTVYNLRHNRKG